MVIFGKGPRMLPSPPYSDVDFNSRNLVHDLDRVEILRQAIGPIVWFGYDR